MFLNLSQNLSEIKFSKISVENLLPNFSHLYIENRAIGYPLSNLALSKFHRSKIIEVEHYKDIFNRTGQDFQIQKASMKLILAKKTAPLLYPLSEMIQDYGTPNKFYNTPILNCLYNCDYCFLQGMYTSGNIVIFVNDDDFMNEIRKQINNLKYPSKPMFVSVSYNTDLMAMENIFPLTSRWINFAAETKNLYIEIRTKSALFSAIKDMQPSDNVILSWTLSPEYISEYYENSAPPLEKRLKSVIMALDKGWKVRLCFDPIIIVKDWYIIYCRFFEKIFSQIDTDKLIDITIGVFRMNKDYYKRIRKREPRSDIFYNSFSVRNGVVAPDKEIRTKVLASLVEKLSHFVPKTKILIWE